MLIVVSSDWHLDAVTDGVRRYDDVRQAVEESVAFAVGAKADAYLMLGDLCDPNTVRCHRSVGYAAQVADRLWHDRSVIFVTGNHDVVEDGSGDNVMLALEPAGASVVSEPTMIGLHEKNGGPTMGPPAADLLMLPYTPASHTYDPAAEVERLLAARSPGRPLIIAGHLNIAGITPGSESAQYARGRDVFWPLDTIQRLAPDALLIGGHYHRRQVYQGVNIVGSLARLTHGEENHEPGFMVIEVNGDTATATPAV